MQLNHLRIGTRLGGGFAVILALAALMMVIGVWRLQGMAEANRDIMTVSLAKERLVDEWFRNLNVGVMRTTAVAKSSDAGLEAFFGDNTKASTARASEIVKTLEAMPSEADEKALMAAIGEQRKRYLATRDAVMKAKRDGKADEAERIFTAEFAGAAKGYLASMQALLDYQQKAIDQAAATMAANASRDTAGLLALGALCVALGTLFAWLLTRSITQPLAGAGRLADAVAGGDLSQHVQTQGKDETASLLRSLGAMTDNLRGMVQQVRQSAESILVASSEVAAGNADLSARTEQAASNLQQTAASVEQITGTVTQSADSARQANQLVSSASEVARRGGTVVAQVVSTMDEINASSKKIADIIGTIDGIAFQTNILALNAAVEAARAGEQGRGFAVVASEVRSLAQRSAEAAKEIKALIGASVDKVESGSKLVADAGSTMSEIVASVQRVSDIIAEISAAAGEQSSGIGQVNGAVAKLDQMTQQNAALVEESAAAAESLREQSRQLAGVVAGFRLDANAAPAGAATTTATAAPARAAQAVIARAKVGAAAAPAAPKSAPKPAPKAAAPKPPVAAAAKPLPAAKPAPAPAPANNDSDWETF